MKKTEIFENKNSLKNNDCKNEILNKKNTSKKQFFMIILASVFIGFFNGFLGGGGGMICVPLLERVLGVDNKKAHATTIFVIAGLSLVSSAFYFAKNKFDFNMILYTAIGVFFGGFLGAILLNKLSGKIVRFIFAFLMLVAGVQMVLWYGILVNDFWFFGGHYWRNGNGRWACAGAIACYFFVCGANTSTRHKFDLLFLFGKRLTFFALQKQTCWHALFICYYFVLGNVRCFWLIFGKCCVGRSFENLFWCFFNFSFVFSIL